MIVVQDRIDVLPANLARVLSLFSERYTPGASRRGLVFRDAQVSPPLALADQPNTLWLHWTLEHAGSFWGARAVGGADPAVLAFWAEIDTLVRRRERRYLVAADSPLPAPSDIAKQAARPRLWRETAQLYLRDGLGEADRARFAALLQDAAQQLPRLRLARLAPNFVADYGAGHFTWDLVYPDRASADSARQGAAWREEILPVLDRFCRARAALGLETIGAGMRDFELSSGVKRTALFRVLPGVSAEARVRFEQDTLEMPAHIEAIRNWRLSRAVPLEWNASDVPPWSYVWEQEFATLEGLTIDYMVHPHHWAHVDRAFDPESGAQIIDAALCHAFCAHAGAFITL
jgi:hypothetical protein